MFSPMSQDNSVGIAMGYELTTVARFPEGERDFFIPPQRLDRILVQLILLCNGYWG
jgi:hypothetical protein